MERFDTFSSDHHRWYHTFVNKTTVYLPDDLKRAVAAAARRRDVSEAEVIRQAIAQAVASEDVPRRGPLFSSDTLMADDVDAHLAGFGER
jgi:Ribbon-helix-helix protein, copG family.